MYDYLQFADPKNMTKFFFNKRNKSLISLNLIDIILFDSYQIHLFCLFNIEPFKYISF